MDRTGSPPKNGVAPIPATQGTSTPNTSVSFRNVRPLQTAFKTNGLVSKKRRSLGGDISFSDLCRSGNDPDAKGIEPLHSAPLLSISGTGAEAPPAIARPLREVVEAAMANRSFNVSYPQNAATMPDTPMKPAFGVTTAATTVRMHRRGRSMGGPFPPRSPLFLPSQRSPPVSMPSMAPQSEMRPSHGRMHMQCSRHMRSVSERIAMPQDLFSIDPPKRLEDADDVFDSPNKSPIRHMPDSILQDSLPALRSEPPTQSSRSTGFAPLGLVQGDRSLEEVPRPASPLESGLSDSGPSSMDSPNNIFSARASGEPRQSTPKWHAVDSPPQMLPFDNFSASRPSRDYTRAWVENTPTGARSAVGASLLPLRGQEDLEGEPNTPTRKEIKWYEATQSPLPQKVYKEKTRPRHSQPAQFSTPARPSLQVLGHSAPAARLRESRMSQFEEHFVVEGVLGTGEFSEVVKVREKATGYVSAVKRMKRPFLGPKDRVRRLEEVDVMCLLKQRRSTWPTAWFGAEGVVDLLDAWEEEGFLFIQAELCPLGSLAFVLAEYGRQVGPLDEARLWKVLAELSAGVDFIHRCGVLHLDLKPANILITEVGTLKITDFGMATRWPRCTAQEVLAGAHLETLKFSHDLSDTSQSPPWQGVMPSAATVQRPRRRTTRARHMSPVMALEREGDREYIAPEVIFESKYGKPADIFSLGLIMLEAACSVELPDNGEPWHKLRRNDFSDVSLESLSPAMQTMITSMLQSDPSMRPTAAELVDLPSLAVVRAWMCRGLQANELDQLPSLGTSDGPAPPSPYPLPPSKYYEPPHNGVLTSDRTVVRIRGSMIQEDEMAFLTEVLQAADSRDTSSPDTSTSLMTEDSIQPEGSCLPVSPIMQPYATVLLSHPDTCVDGSVSAGMDIDKALSLDRSL